MKKMIHTRFDLKWWSNVFDGGDISGEAPVVEPPAAPFETEPTVNSLLTPLIYHP